ncbi:MAG TPA: acyl-CoA dehydrogenase family protein [Hyphomicrobiales bacterium]|nr:acyl-CoA dehydrogenase family protein [Hyphomicrobiales bacterium]
MTVLDMRVAGARRRATDLPWRPSRADFGQRAAAAAAVAAAHAEAVDRDGRFPAEAIDALRAQGLMSIMVPATLGGEAAPLGAVADVCYALGRACASTAMIYAMHQTKVACLVRHGRGSPYHERLLRRLGIQQLLLASSTTEGNGGGNVRASAAAVAEADGRITLRREATVISYGAEADGVVTTARRSADAPASDQVLIAFLKEDYLLERIQGWETLGMRGTCSAGFVLTAAGEAEQIVPEPYETIHARTMTPTAHVLWSSVWAGIAAAAVERARAFTRTAARKAGGQLPPGAAHLTEANASLATLRALIAAALRRYEAIANDGRALSALDFQTEINLLKVDASERAVATVMSAMRAAGLAGYRNDGEFSIGRHLRDILSSPVMISNDRIRASVATGALMAGTPASLAD